jgi:hypothetical protein
MQRATNREKCYTARDEYHQCLNQNGASAKVCEPLKATLEAACPSSWITYFNQQRERQTMLEMQADISRQRTSLTQNREQQQP